MQQISIEVGNQKQNIYTGFNIIEPLVNSNLLLKYSSVHIVCDINVQFIPSISRILNGKGYSVSHWDISLLHKDLLSVHKLLKVFHLSKLSRGSLVICIGGGTLSDICGTACSLYMRGIDYIQIGTTLMSQADCIISKVAVCEGNWKNVYGAFYTPVATINDNSIISNDDKQKNAISEIIKHYLIDITNLEEFNNKLFKLSSSSVLDSSFSSIVSESCMIKAKYVEGDPYDQRDIQKGLSLGHTFANLIESIDPHIDHGYAVWVGLMLCLIVSESVFGLDKRLLSSLKEVMKNISLEKKEIFITKEKAQEILSSDKISNSGEYSLILLESLGLHKVVRGIDFKIIENAFKQCELINYAE